MTHAKLKVLVKNTESNGNNSVPGLLLWPYQILAQRKVSLNHQLCATTTSVPASHQPQNDIDPQNLK